MVVAIDLASVDACEARVEAAVSDDHHDDDDASSRSANIVHRIAELLGIPKATLVERVNTEAEMDATTEMLRIWSGIDNPADRRKILAFARGLAAARK